MERRERRREELWSEEGLSVGGGNMEWDRAAELEMIIALRGTAADPRLETGGLCLNYEKERGVILLSFKDESGRGRKLRRAKIGKLCNIRIFLDSSAAEIYINAGETLLSTRLYPENECLPLYSTVDTRTL